MSQSNYHDQVPYHGWDFRYAGGKYVPRQTSGPSIPAVAPLHQPQPVAYCKICDVKLGSYKNVEPHNNGKRHQRMLILHDDLQSQRLRTSNGQIPNSKMNLAVQPKTVLKSGENGQPVKNLSSEATTAKPKNYLQKDIGVTSEGPEGNSRGNTGAQGHSLKRKIGGANTSKYLKTNDGVRRPMESSKLDINSLSDCVESPIQIPALAPRPGPVTSHIMAPTSVVGSSFKQPNQHVSASQTQVLEGKNIQIPALAPWPGPVTSHIMAPTSVVGSSFKQPNQHVSASQTQVLEGKNIQIPALAPRPGPVTSHIMAPTSVVGSSFKQPNQHVSASQTQVLEGKNIQIPALAPRPGPVTSHIMAPTPVVGSSFKQPNQHVSASQTQVLEGKKYPDIQNPTVETNYQPHAPAYSNINTIPEDVSSDSAARAIRPPKGPIVSQVSTLRPSVAYCKICEVKLPNCKIMDMHYKGKRHQRMSKLHENLQRQKTSNGQIPNSQKSLVVQPKRVQISGKNGHPLKNMSSEASVSKHKNYLQKDMRLTSEVPAKGPEGKPRDNSGAQDHGFKHGKTCTYITNEGVRRPMESSKLNTNSLSKSVDSPVQNSIPALTPLPGPVASQIMAPTLVEESSFKLQVQHVSASEGKGHHEIQNPTAEMTDQPHAPADSDINTQTKDMSSDSVAIAMASPEGFMASQVYAPSLAVGSSFEPQIQNVLQTQVLQSKELEIQNPTMEMNDQPQSILVELHAPVGSDINPQTDDVSSDSETIGPPKGLAESQAFALTLPVGSSFESQIPHVLQTEMSKGKKHNEVQNPTAETNDQPQSISVELHPPSGSDISTQTEDVTSDFAAIAMGPASQVSIPPTVVGSSFGTQIQHVLHIETEPQLSKATADYESQNCIDEKDNQLLPSVVVEFNSHSDSSTNTQTADGSSKADENMDNLTNQSGITQLSQVAVCLKCGDVGFPETRIFCNKCQVYALHRYCLDGPVVFTDDVTWFCEDCEMKVVDTFFHDQCSLLPSGKNVSLNLAKDASQARIEPKNCIESVKNNKQRPQNIADKTKVLLSDNHSLSHHGLSKCSNNSEMENKFEKECQPVPRDEANSNEGSMIVTVPQPIADPVWRGSLCLSDPSFDTVIGLLAHMSTLACSKVLEETRLFPDVLCPDLLQRSAVWPKSFMKCGPNEESIALYFFPDTESVERVFDKLVDDMISFDLAIKAVVENAELLVFPSTLLPIPYRRFQEKYYLWGVFRAKKTSHNTNDAVRGEVTSIDKSLTLQKQSPSKTLKASCSSSTVTQ